MFNLPSGVPLNEMEEYKQLSDRYYKEILESPEIERLRFFANIQKELERTLRHKFRKEGYKMVRENPKDTLNSSPPGMYYKIVSAKDAFDFNLIKYHLVLSNMLKDICFTPIPSLPLSTVKQNIPDVKILIPEYRKKKIQDMSEHALQKFKEINSMLATNSKFKNN